MALPLALVFILLGSVSGGGGSTDLKIRVWPQGRPGPSKAWTLRCNPPAGTLSRSAKACGRLAAIAGPFAPVPRDAVCTQNYGGPQVALVSGTYRGARIWTLFQRRNGCEIARWTRVAFLFPVRT